MSFILNNIAQIIYLAKKAKEQVRQKKTHSAHRLIAMISSLDKTQLHRVKKESYSEELFAQTKEIHRLSQQIHKETSSKELVRFLDNIISLEENEIRVLQKENKSLAKDTLHQIDPFIRDLMNEMNKLPFIKQTHFSCEGRLPTHGLPYVVIEYVDSEKYSELIFDFDKKMQSIVPWKSITKRGHVGYTLMNAQEWNEIRDFHSSIKKIEQEIKKIYFRRWRKIAQVVHKFEERTSLQHKSKRLRLHSKNQNLHH